MRPRRQKAGPVGGLLLSFLFALLFVATATADLFVYPKLSPAAPLPLAIRIPSLGIYQDTFTQGTSFRHRAIRHPRGAQLRPEQQRLVGAFEQQRRPPSPPLLLGLGLTFFLLLLLFTSHLRGLTGAAGLLRTQLVLLLSLWLLALGGKALLLGTSWSALWLPLLVIVIPIAYHLGSRPAGAIALAGSISLSLLTPLDLQLLLVLAAQGVAAALLIGRRPRPSSARLLAGTVGATFAGGLAYVASSLLLQQYVPLLGGSSLSSAATWLSSDLVAAAGGGLVGGALALVALPLGSPLLGVLSRSKLIALADFDNALLKQIASRAPGTWAHSMTVANMAEMAANSIGANALLVRVGAYYHDLGKSVQPGYFIENQEGQNPHESLDPEVSADAIFAHVSDGVKLARKHKIPEPVIEFIYTHHGSGLLEYFWHKNLAQGNPKGLAEEDFRYPGCAPRSPETAILSICDAVEAASRTIADVDQDTIQRLVRQIVFTKLDQTMLNSSGLTINDLQRIVDSLVDTLRSSFHLRVKYPWQQQAQSQPAAGSEEPAEGQRLRTSTVPLGVKLETNQPQVGDKR